VVSALSEFAARFREDQWAVGVVDAEISKFASGAHVPTVRWLGPRLHDAFIADPFGLVRNGVAYVLAERYEFRTRKGVIVALELDGDRLSDPRVVLELPVHLSYPYLVEHGGEVFCIPDTHQLRSILLFRATVFPWEWTRVATLVGGVAAADTTVFRHADRWWLLCADVAEDPLGNTLLGWYADQLDGPWRPHAKNPLRRDPGGSRPAGTPFTHAGRLYRPTQDCSVTYGAAVIVNEILLLTPTEFEERAVGRVAPDRGGPFPKGLHTLSSLGSRTLVDGKRRVFSGAAVREAFTLGKGT
jgi:hypothetical protein